MCDASPVARALAPESARDARAALGGAAGRLARAHPGPAALVRLCGRGALAAETALTDARRARLVGALAAARILQVQWRGGGERERGDGGGSSGA